jgi:hypothetical protein
MLNAPAHPPLLTTRDAAAYLRFRSTSGIRTAVMRRELVPCGGGPKACHMFTVAELDRFVAARGARYARRIAGDRLATRSIVAPQKKGA